MQDTITCFTEFVKLPLSVLTQYMDRKQESILKSLLIINVWGHSH